MAPGDVAAGIVAIAVTAYSMLLAAVVYSMKSCHRQTSGYLAILLASASMYIATGAVANMWLLMLLGVGMLAPTAVAAAIYYASKRCAPASGDRSAESAVNS